MDVRVCDPQDLVTGGHEGWAEFERLEWQAYRAGVRHDLYVGEWLRGKTGWGGCVCCDGWGAVDLPELVGPNVRAATGSAKRLDTRSGLICVVPADYLPHNCVASKGVLAEFDDRPIAEFEFPDSWIELHIWGMWHGQTVDACAR